MKLTGKRAWGLLLWACALKKGGDVQVLIMVLVAQHSILRGFEDKDEDGLFPWWYCCWLCM